jgi:hypothetical protein
MNRPKSSDFYFDLLKLISDLQLMLTENALLVQLFSPLRWILE